MFSLIIMFRSDGDHQTFLNHPRSDGDRQAGAKNLVMNFSPGNVYHIYNQGNNHQKIFSCDEEYEIFLNLIRANIFGHCEIINWCLMPNHFHLMIYTDERILNIKKQGGLEIDVLTNGVRKLLSGYARIYNSRHNASGSLFRQKTKSKCLSDTHFLITPKQYNDSYFNCFHYIHQNLLSWQD